MLTLSRIASEGDSVTAPPLFCHMCGARDSLPSPNALLSVIAMLSPRPARTQRIVPHAIIPRNGVWTTVSHSISLEA
jgi:hypothetical protein